MPQSITHDANKHESQPHSRFLPLRRAGTDLMVDHLLKSKCHKNRPSAYILITYTPPPIPPGGGTKSCRKLLRGATEGIGSPLPWEGLGVGQIYPTPL
jgi:hypothetical protein